MFGKFLAIIALFITSNNCAIKAASLIDTQYYGEVIAEQFCDNLSAIYSATTDIDCIEANAYAYGEKKSSWDIATIKIAALAGNPIAQYCMYREAVKKAVESFNGQKSKAYVEASVWLLCSIHHDCHLTKEVQIQWSDMLPANKENLEQVSASIKTLAKFLAG